MPLTSRREIRLRPAAWMASTLLSALAPSSARAEAPCENRPRVQVQVEAASRSSLVRRTVDLVTAELAGRKAPCEGANEERSAQIVVRFLDASRVRIEVELNFPDRTQRIERDVDHTRIPADGIPSALAIAADELLRAAYEQVEIEELEEPRKTEASPPSEVKEPAPPPLEEPRPRWLGLALAGEIFPRGRDFLGIDARFGLPLGSKLTLEAHAGLRAVTKDEPAEARLSRLWLLGGMARLELARPAKALGIDGVAGADAIFALHGSQALVRPALRLGARGAWDPGARMRLEIGIEALWLPLSLATPPSASPSASGFAIAPSLGWLVHF